ncbi:FirrV-1-G2 [Feldmannia irregularis virus a]|uniref:FirrV-1-G2 n=1 Tax=Feldmannia irregularis virus a TaxID=231992 RepID=Q6XLV1_9PHYC|nr:FirrV-1-G2 [Feldmannia irregularis virus a]AAR26960.1 FirrV-1-G2 [Feldmannia irregularis virus a]
MCRDGRMPKRKHKPREMSFVFEKDEDDSTWSCPLLCQRCAYVRPNGEQCKKRVCVGHPFCWIHVRAAFGVTVKTSTIPNAGKGLFATRDFKKNTWICPYFGEIIDANCFVQRYPGKATAPYAEMLPLNTTPRKYVDSACTRSVGSLANGKFKGDGSVSSLRHHNCFTRYRPVGDGFKGVWLKSTKTIKAGDEIFNWYGEGNYNLFASNHSTKRRTKAPDSRPCPASQSD